MERKEAIRGAYRMTGGNSLYDGMITCSTLSGESGVPLGVGNEQGGKRRLSGRGNVRYSGNVAGAALESWNGVLCGRLQRDDGAGCGAGIRK